MCFLFKIKFFDKFKYPKIAIGSVLAVCLIGCSQQVLDDARARGSKLGYSEGNRTGEAEGYEYRLKNAENIHYNLTLRQLIETRDYRRVPLYSVLALTAGFTIGLFLQYIALYMLRRFKLLQDIDFILLPEYRLAADPKLAIQDDRQF